MPVEPTSRHEERLQAHVARHAGRKLAGRRATDRELWFGLGVLGLVGWSIALPAVAGALAGAWLDRARPGGVPWTVAGLGLGLAIGLANAWRWVVHEHARPLDGETREEDDDA